MSRPSINIIEHGEELLSSGGLTWLRNSQSYVDQLQANFLMQWPATSNIFDTNQSEEEIVLVSAKMQHFKSEFHFTWKIISFLRKIEAKSEVLEIISETENKKITFENAISSIRKTSGKWWANYAQLLPYEGFVYQIWDDSVDICFVFENQNNYTLWNWRSTA